MVDSLVKYSLPSQLPSTWLLNWVLVLVTLQIPTNLRLASVMHKAIWLLTIQQRLYTGEIFEGGLLINQMLILPVGKE